MTVLKVDVLPGGTPLRITNAQASFAVSGAATNFGIVGTGALNLGAAKTDGVFVSHPVSNAGADKILAKLKPAKPRKVRKYKGELKQSEAKLAAALNLAHGESDRRIIAMDALRQMEAKAGRYLGAAVVGWVLSVGLLIFVARLVWGPK